jgi:hypothetical protein
MVLIAFSLQSQVEKYGAYVGLAAFFGLAVLTLLYFAQAREVKRLREWAGRAPERAAELEQAVAQHAEEARRTPVPAPQPASPQEPVPVAEPVAATNGAVTLKPAEVAALAFARSAGVHTPHVPTPHPAPAAAAAVAAPPTQVASVAAPATNGGGGAVPPPPVPAPATPAARRDQAPLPPRRTAPPTRRTPPPPPRRESNTRAVVLTAVVGVLVLAGAAFGATKLFGGGSNNAPSPGASLTATATPSAPKATTTATPAPVPTKATALVGVYNGTQVSLLAAQYRDLLKADGYPQNNLGAATAPAQLQRQTSVVMYKRGARAVAAGVADVLGMTDVQQIDAATQNLIASAQKKWDVVVIVGADKSS